MLKELFEIEQYRACFLSPENIPALDSLCYRCSDYYRMATGSPPGPDAGYELYFDLPPGKEMEDKFLLGFFNREGKMVGIVDMIRDYPVKTVNYIGLMLIDPSERRKGLGEKIIDRLLEWLKQSNVNELRLGVVRQNTSALNFWKKVGFVETGEKKMEIAAQRFLNIINMKLSIANGVQQQDLINYNPLF